MRVIHHVSLEQRTWGATPMFIYAKGLKVILGILPKILGSLFWESVATMLEYFENVGLCPLSVTQLRGREDSSKSLFSWCYKWCLSGHILIIIELIAFYLCALTQMKPWEYLLVNQIFIRTQGTHWCWGCERTWQWGMFLFCWVAEGGPFFVTHD